MHVLVAEFHEKPAPEHQVEFTIIVVLPWANGIGPSQEIAIKPRISRPATVTADMGFVANVSESSRLSNLRLSHQTG